MPTNDTEFQNSTGLGADESDPYTLKQPGAESLSGSVTRQTTAYDVKVTWLDGSDTEIETEEIATGVGGGTQTTFDVPARSPYAKLIVADNASGSGDYDLVAHFR